MFQPLLSEQILSSYPAIIPYVAFSDDTFVISDDNI